MKYLSVCAGIEAATCAWHHMGWEPVAFSEIEKFPSAVLAHHYPNVPNWGDMTKYKEWPDANVDVLVGGTPCQSFSVAGLRKGLDDPRGNLMLTYLAIAKRYRPEWLVWENVPGVLSSAGGRDFAALLRGLDELGYGWAYRVLDAQFFGVAQRRRRVFVVGHLGNWQRAAAVLFERHSLSGHPAPSRQAREGLAKCVTTGVGKRYDPETDTMIPVAHPSWWDGGDVAATITTKSDDQRMPDKANAQLVMQPISFPWQMGGTIQMPVDKDLSGSLIKNQTMAVAQPVAFSVCPDHCGGDKSGQEVAFVNEIDVSRTLDCTGADVTRKQGGVGIAAAMQVRRLLPEECEKLQGFLPGYTNIPWRGKPESPDGPRYKALGNSMAVPCMVWIGERINEVSKL